MLGSSSAVVIMLIVILLIGFRHFGSTSPNSRAWTTFAK